MFYARIFMYIKGHYGPPLQTDGGVLYTPFVKNPKKPL